MTERFTRINDRVLRYEVTVDDPATWTKPWTAAFPLEQDPAFYLYEFACHEGNFGACVRCWEGSPDREVSSR